MKYFYNLILLLYSFNAFAQKVIILDVKTHQPIVNVAVFNEDKSKNTISNKKGEVDISIFSDSDILTFSHVAYIEFETLLKQIKIYNYRVYLRDKSESLQEVFLIASKGKEKRSRIAEQIEGVSFLDIQKLSPQSAADVLADIPGVKVQKSQFGGGSPVIRGMEANRVLLVIDGVRMNNAIYRKGHLQNSITVSPTQLDRTEVIFGPSSVVYGSDALGGVIHYYTKTPLLSNRKKLKTNYLSRFSTVNNGFVSQIGVESGHKNWASYTSVAYSSFGDLKMGSKRSHGFNDWGKQPEYSNNTSQFYNQNPVVNTNPQIQHNVGYHQVDVLQKFLKPLSSKTNLKLNLQYSTSSNIPRFDKLTEYKNGALKFAEWHYGPQNRLLLSSQLEINPNKKWIDNGTITVAYQDIRESRINRKFGSLNRNTRKEKVNVYSFNADFFVPLTQKEDRVLSYGLETTYNDVSSKAHGETLNIIGNKVVGISENYFVQSRYADGGSTYLSSAAYIDYRQTISKKATLNTGVRFTRTNLNATWIDQTLIALPNSDISINNSAVTLTAGYVYKPTNKWQINSVLSSGFRSPNIDDVGKVREKKGKVTVPNANLKPEFAYNAEIGLLKYFNDKKSHIGLTTYYTLLDKYITREAFTLNGSQTILFDGEMGAIVANVNKNNAYVTGATFELKTLLYQNLIFKTSFTYTKGHAHDTNEPLSSIPPLFGNASITYTKPTYEISIYSRFNGRKKLKDYNPTEGIDNIEQTPFIVSTGAYYGTPAWSTLNFYINSKINKNIDFNFSVSNLLDQHYKEFASAISAAGRNFTVSLMGNF
ncbi:MAG: TonB-dependent receptor [Flavobacteriaceae bacterium]|nr:TonB-dependent receptor [Flavobacteriaceae bacterium]